MKVAVCFTRINVCNSIKVSFFCYIIAPIEATIKKVVFCIKECLNGNSKIYRSKGQTFIGVNVEQFKR